MFSRNRYIPYGTINLFINERNHYSSFCTAYRYNTKDIDNALMYGDLYFDFDTIDDFEKVRKDAFSVINFLKICFTIDADYLKLYYSGNKGIHIIVPAVILGVEPHRQLNGIYKHIAAIAKGYSAHKTVDLQIYDNKRLFRIPNTIHEKSKLYKIPITLDELCHSSIEEIKEKAKSPRTIETRTALYMPQANQRYQQSIREFLAEEEAKRKYATKRFDKKFTFIPPCITNLIENGAREGERNLSIACLSGFYKSYGKTLDETIELITDWNDNNIKPTGTNEMIKTIKSIFNSEKQFGCATLSSISECDKTCPVYIKKNEKNTNGSKVT